MERERAGGKALARVLIVDNSLIHTQLLVEALRRNHDLEIFGSDSRVKSVIETALAANLDVLVISSSLGEQSGRGFEVLRELRGLRPELRTVVMLDSSKTEDILEAFRAGAAGVFSRNESIERLGKCIRCVHQGQIWANSQQMAIALEALASSHTVRAVDASGHSLLSKREKEIVQSLAEGLTNREIAERLRLSQHTVKNYLFRIFDKLGASNRIELLFMTLSQTGGSQPIPNSFFKNYIQGGLQEVLASVDCQQAAEQGEPIAQLALAQLLSARRDSSKDIVQAYKWYLIASGQILQAGKEVSRAMTMEQLIHAEHMASDWLKKTQNISLSCLQEDRPPSMAMGSGSR